MRRWIQIAILILLGVIGAASSLSAQADVDREIEALKKQLGEIQQRIKVLEDERNAAKKAGEPVHVGKGSLRVSGLMQNWYVHDNNTPDTFRTRRMEIRLIGSVTPRISYNTMIDPAKRLTQNPSGTIDQASRILQDAFITTQLGPGLSVDVGQYKIPMTLEGLQSSATLETIERALFMVRGNAISGAWGDYRDLGITLNGVGKTIGYQAGIFNGQAQNTFDTNDHKDPVLRVVLQPDAVPGLHLGAYYYDGRFNPNEIIRRRAGAEFRWQKGPLLLKSEYIEGQDGVINRAGWYALGGYYFSPKLQGVFRYDRWNPNINLPGFGETDYTVGLNYYIEGNNAKIQINYIAQDRDGSFPDSDLILSNYQVSF